MGADAGDSGRVRARFSVPAAGRGPGPGTGRACAITGHQRAQNRHPGVSSDMASQHIYTRIRAHADAEMTSCAHVSRQVQPTLACQGWLDLESLLSHT